MPIYEYRAAKPQLACTHCGPGFEQLQRLKDLPLEECPACGAPLRRVISPPAVHAGGLLDPANVAKHGFTQYRKVRKGEYEKTAGEGPRHLSDD